MLKMKLTKEAFSDLDEGMQKFYKENGGSYFLEVERDNDDDALKRAKDHEKERRKEVEAKFIESQSKMAELQKQLDEFNNKKVENSGDVEEIRGHYQKKVEELTSLHASELEKVKTNLTSTLINGATSDILASINPIETFKPVLKQLIQQRLQINEHEGNFNVGYLDKEGKPSLNDLTGLKQELLENNDISNMLVGTKANGSGATSGHNSSGGGAPSKVDFTKMGNTQQMVDYLSSKAK